MIEFKDVIRIESAAEGGLDALLRPKQLGFECFTNGSGIPVVRMGYKDSNNKVYYFSGDNESFSEYWKPNLGKDGRTNIYYEAGKVAVGKVPDFPAFEVMGPGGSVSYQIRMSYSNYGIHRHASMGVNGDGVFAVNIGEDTTSRVFAAPYGSFGFRSKYGDDSKITYYPDDGMHIEAAHDNIQIKTPDNKNIVLEPGYNSNSGVMLACSGSAVCKWSYSAGSRRANLEALGYDRDLRIKAGFDSGNVIIEPGQELDSPGIVQMNFASGTARFYGADQSTCIDHNNGEGHSRCISIGKNTVAINSKLLQLPVHSDHPVIELGGVAKSVPVGSMYFNDKLKKLFVCIRCNAVNTPEWKEIQLI
ncbi:MAG: hypothetical protein LBI42_09875 [Chitinispirillales bacterium]|nr:hypothetical protein [Chitinispirillales bacterium]